ncbi:ferritin-like domain-containing protein [Anabaena azotica]|uniref:Ferritin-like protein n=1 Tax=Anabaena azotica FACHB-119 TaxID=947527 RepID=A0ABR8D8L7_9NOST|nr:ferritin-like protein [Anabaena azotica]MBD2502103.1 ferritin-like protein [Anabaena azotica FACHB-119]
MLKIHTSVLKGIFQASGPAKLYSYLQSAIQLEHSTIPLYLTGLYSIKLGSNQDAYNIILSVVIEEMLHMTIAANVLNAIGGRPIINQPGFIPSYPGPLPMNIGDLRVNLAPLSKDVLFDTFMKIEEPEHPINFPVKRLLAEEAPSYATIGQFYQAIIEKLQELGPKSMIGNPALQVVNDQWFPLDQLFPIRTLDDAVRGLELIVQQGEGTQKSPLDPEGEFAHYYRFAEIYYGRRLRPDSTTPEGYSYSGDPISLDQDNIWDLVENSKAKMYKPGTMARRLVDQFNYSYTSLLNSLHETFNGKPDSLNTGIGIMIELKLQAQKMTEKQIESTDLNDGVSPKGRVGKYLAPSFEYALVND